MAPSRAAAPARPAVVKPKAASKPASHAAPKAAPKPAPKAAPKPAPRPKPIVYPSSATGRATWGHFGGRVITRLPKGTQIRVCGPHGCWTGVSSGYGPAPADGGLVDLDAAIFERICGPLRTGVATIVLSWR
jgi:hypothetical protein